MGKVLFALGHEMGESSGAERATVKSLSETHDRQATDICFLSSFTFFFSFDGGPAALVSGHADRDRLLERGAPNHVADDGRHPEPGHLQQPHETGIPAAAARYEQWMEFRGRSINLNTDPRDAINLYLLVARDLEKHYQKFTPSSIYYSAGNALKTPFINSGIAYSVFNSGMYQRFAQIALGTCYVRSNLILNHTEFLDLQFTSTALIASAFQFHPRAQTRYYELRYTDAESIDAALSIVRQDMLTGGRNRNDSQLANTYLEGVKNEIAQLLLSKDYPEHHNRWSDQISVSADAQYFLLLLERDDRRHGRCRVLPHPALLFTQVPCPFASARHERGSCTRLTHFSSDRMS